MYTLKIKNAAGELFELSDSVNYTVYKITGLTPPKADINTSPAGAIDGTFFNSARMNQRNIVINLAIEGDIETNRQNLYRIFPEKSLCTVYFKNHNMDVKIEGYVEVVEGDIFAARERMQISIICPRPYWQTLDEIVYEISTTLRLFEFPFSIAETPGIPISTYDSNPQIHLYNDGTAVCGFTASIDFSGSVTGFALYNLTTQQKLQLMDTVTLADGDTVEISTMPGSLTIKKISGGAETNLINYLASGSEFFGLAVGDNLFYMSATSGDVDDMHADIIPVFLYGGV